MYRMNSLSPQSSNEVSVMGLSDSDTTASPTLGSSSASEKFLDPQEAEAFSLSLDLRNARLDDRSTPEVISGRSSASGDDRNETIVEEDGLILHETQQAFNRSDEKRVSDNSDNSSISQGIQADKDFGKHGSDISDFSEGRLTPKNQKDLESYLQVTDESGIVSETTSSNQSEGSQQSDQTNFKFDPTEIAQKIMNDVSEHKTALDSMQRFSSFQMQQEANCMRSEYQKKVPSPSVTTAEKTSTDGSSSASDMTSIQSKIAAFSGINQSAFTSPLNKPRPPAVAAKPSFTANTSSFRNLSSKVQDLSSISSPETAMPSGNVSNQSTKTSKLHSEHQQSSPSNVYTTTAIVVSKKDSFSPSANSSATMSFSSFRPSGKPVDTSQYRPESTTSTSSHCSTPSSMQSVIYRPYGDSCNPDSPCVVSYDSSSDQTSGSGSAGTLTGNISDLPSLELIPTLKRDSSPALSSCSSTSGRSGKQKKKVSFSDSEPSDTPSPLDSSSNSNQLSYFDMNKAKLNPLPSRPSNLKQQQNLSSSSIDSIGLNKSGSSGGSASRPPPPSYQYAIRNSKSLSKSADERSPRPLIQHQISAPNCSSNSSLNNSMEDQGRFPNGVSNRSPMVLPLQQSSPVHRGQTYMNSFEPSTGIPPQTNHMPVYNSYPENSQRNLSAYNNHPNFQARTNSSDLSPVRQIPNMQPGPISTSTPDIPPRGIPPAQRPTHMNLNMPQQKEPMSRSQTSMLLGQQPMSRSQGHLVGSTNFNGSYPGPRNMQAQPSTKTALLRQPLSSPDSPKDYFPPNLNQSRIPESNMVPNHYPDNMNPMGQNSYARSQSLDHISKYSPNTGQLNSPSHSFENKDFPQRVPSSYSHSQSSPMDSGPMIEHHLPGPIRSPQFTIYPPTSQMTARTGSLYPEQPRRNPPVPPARMDSRENMDRHPINQSSGHIPPSQIGLPNHISPQHMPTNQHQGPKGHQPGGNYQNSYMREQTSNYINQMYNSNMNSNSAPNYSNYSISQDQNGYANDSVANLSHDSPTSTGPLRRIGIGSEKKCFTKTNVVQASKC